MQEPDVLKQSHAASPGLYGGYTREPRRLERPIWQPSRKMLFQAIKAASCCIIITAALVSAANYNVEIRGMFNRLPGIGESGAQFVTTDRGAAAFEKAAGPSPASYRVEPASIRGHASAADGLAAPISLASVTGLGVTAKKAAGTE